MKNSLALHIIIILVLTFALPFTCLAKESMKGYEFWLGFFNNNLTNEHNELLILIASEEFTEGTVSIPKLNWSQEFRVNGGASISVKIPNDLGIHKTSGVVENKGIKITSTGRISVFAINSSSFTSDGSFILPKQNLHKDYWAMSYQGFNNSANELLIVATEDNTLIEIDPSVETENGHMAKVPFSITLNEGQSYMLRTKSQGDITGTRIRGIAGCNPFAVFSGAKGAHIPFDCSAVDHIFHQMLPDKHLGLKYLLSPINTQYSCRILATEDNTQIRLDGAYYLTLQKGEHTSIHNRKNALLIEAEKPLLVAQFLQGSSCSPMGDPGMAIVSPINKAYKKVQFSIPNIANIETVYAEIITKTGNGNQVKLNGGLIEGFLPIASMPGYGYKKIEITSASAILEADSGLTAMVYGLGWANSYLFSAGYREDISLEVLVDRKICIGSAANFNCTVDEAKEWSWDFGDNNSSKGKSVTYQYQSPGTYQFTLTIYNDEECPTIYKDFISVVPYPLLDLPKEASACGDYVITLSAKERGLSYKWSSGETTQSIQAKTSGTYILEASNNTCTSTDTVEVIITPYPHIVEISSDTTIFINTSAQLYASGGSTFQWSPPYSISCTDCPEPIVSPSQTTTYKIKIYDQDGCMALDSVKVIVDMDLKVFVPNIFSPNNDGQNDVLFVNGKGIKSMKFFIYNRWGEKVFESMNLDQGWDGTFKGTPLPPSVFVYYVDAIMESGERIVRKGDVTLIK
jgi:gliding motility-associated-like protein